MKQVIMFFILLFALALDCIVFPALLFWGIRPTIVLCFVLCLGLQNGRFTGSMCGLCVGFMMDYLYGPSLGYYAILMMITGYAACAFYINRFSESVIMLAVYTAGVFCGMQLLFALAASLAGARMENIFLLFLRYIIPSGILTGLCVIPVNAFVRWLFGFNVMKKKWKISLE